MTDSSKIQLLRRYFAALEQGNLDAAPEIFGPDMLQTEYPNLLKPGGDQRDIAALVQDSHRGAKILTWQRYDICAIVEQGNLVAVEVFWEGELAISIGTMQAGDRMTAYSAMFFTFADSKITRQSNYDCFTRAPIQNRK